MVAKKCRIANQDTLFELMAEAPDISSDGETDIEGELEGLPETSSGEVSFSEDECNDDSVEEGVSRKRMLFGISPDMTSCKNLLEHVSAMNNTGFQIPTFNLIGIPGLEYAHIWISIPFCIMYIIAVFGNTLILFIIKTEERLHRPMLIFLCMLAGADLIVVNSVLPKALGIFWFDSREIYLNSCLHQMYISHVFSSFVLGWNSFESGVLALMALDRYVAITNPLRYTSILSNQRAGILGLSYLFRSALYFAPCPYLVKRLSYSKNNTIAHTYCEHMSVAKLSCSDITVNIIYGLSITLLNGAQDISFIIFSYIMILRAVSRLSTWGECWKALNTCMSHICVMTVFYIPILTTVFIQRFNHSIIPYIHILVANIYILIPPMVNPLVYGIQTQQIRVKLLSLICHIMTELKTI
ncbi:olfactory receptor 51E2-like [Ambystoma mexicanum]|uniref:olfactory receptor 51E2-like n=1 Tax=Ambystoma mexicanum TaxID=8296 RepID=UPI0037E9B465